MQDTPPRRSRRPPPGNSGSSFPLLPVVLGTIVIGFVIGAGLSMAGKHGAATVAIATSSPTLEPTLAPATLAPTEKPTHEPTDEPATAPPVTFAPSERPATDAPATHAPATHVPATHTPATQAPRVGSSAAAEATPPAATPASGPATAASVTPARVRSTVGPPSAAPASNDDADSDFGRLAAGVVRGYLAAIARGDSASAAASLASSSDRVTEGSVVDGTTRIKHVEARGAGDAATVNVDFDTSTGAYFGQYTVRRSATGAAVIVAHTIIKP